MSGVSTEARARQVLAEHLEAAGFRALVLSARGTGLEAMVAAMLAFAADAPPGWKPPATMPRDGTMFLAGLYVRTNGREPDWEQFVVSVDDETGEFAYGSEAGWDADDIEAWHPLPAAPTPEAAKEASA